MIKRLSIIALILLLVGIIGSIFTINTQWVQAEMLEEKMITNEFNHIDLYADNAEITLLATNEKHASVELHGNHSRYDLTADVVDNALKVDLQSRSKFFHVNPFTRALSLTVYIPQKTYDTIYMTSKNGQMDVNDVEGDEIEVKTNNGRIDVNSIKGQTVVLEADNGKIELQDVVANLINVEAENGKIEMENIEGEIIGKTNNGMISLITENLDRPIELSSDNGKIDIQSKDRPTNTILDVKVDNGKVSVFGESNWDTVIGNGENIIKLRTNNGSITISE